MRAQSVQLRYYEVVAPVAGTVGDIPVRVGDYVAPQTLLTTLDDNQALEAYVDIPLERAASLKLGTPVEMIDAAGQVLAPSEVTFISPRADSDTQTVLIKTHVHNPDGPPALVAVHARARHLGRAPGAGRAGAGGAEPERPVVRVGRQARAPTAASPPSNASCRSGRSRARPIRSCKGVAVGEMIVSSGVQKLRPGARVAPSISDAGRPSE